MAASCGSVSYNRSGLSSVGLGRQGVWRSFQQADFWGTFMKNLGDTQKKVIDQTRAFMKEDRARSTRTVIVAHALFVGLSSAALIAEWLVIKLLFSLVAGLVLTRCFVLYHDFLHGSILRKSKWANVLFRMFSVAYLTPKSVWKETHNYHHTHNSKLPSSHIGSYKIVSKETWAKMTTKERIEYRWIRNPVNMAVGGLTVFVVGMIFTPLFRNFKKNVDALFVLLGLIAVSALGVLVFGWLNTFVALWLPQLVAGAFGSYLFFVQHNFPSVQFKPLKDWSYYDAALDSSCFIDMHPIMHWFSGNIGYHHIHHLNPMIPFYRLPEVMEAIPELAPKHTIGFSLSDMKACLSLKIWDEQKGAMVGY